MAQYHLGPWKNKVYIVLTVKECTPAKSCKVGQAIGRRRLAVGLLVPMFGVSWVMRRGRAVGLLVKVKKGY